MDEKEFLKDIEDIESEVNNRLEENQLLRDIADAKAALRINLSNGVPTSPDLLTALESKINKRVEALDKRAQRIKRRKK